MYIDDGSGKGYSAKVNNRNQLLTSAITIPNSFYVAREEKKYFDCAMNAQSITGADDFFFYLSNTGTKDIVIENLRFTASAACTIELHQVTGTPSGGSALTPSNRYIGAAEVLTATIQSGANITGLTSAAEHQYVPISGARVFAQVGWSAGVHVPPGKAVALLSDTGSINITGSVSVFETSIDLSS